MAYSLPTDLLIGGLAVSSKIDKQVYVDAAADEIDIVLGLRYETPVDVNDLDDSSFKLLKKINNYLATGRLIMALSINGQEDTLNAYAMEMVRVAINDLEMLRMGAVELVGATYKDGASGNNKAPTIINQDESSAISVFEDFAMKYHPYPVSIYWEPGS